MLRLADRRGGLASSSDRPGSTAGWRCTARKRRSISRRSTAAQAGLGPGRRWSRHVRHGDKHGGRHYYLQPLSQAFPEAWIDRGPEGPDLSRYTIRDRNRRLELTLMPRADQCDGLVALASIVSKTVRELWMDVFNAYWRGRIPGLRPTAGYPSDAVRFRQAIERIASAEGHDPAHWWRIK